MYTSLTGVIIVFAKSLNQQGSFHQSRAAATPVQVVLVMAIKQHPPRYVIQMELHYLPRVTFTSVIPIIFAYVKLMLLMVLYLLLRVGHLLTMIMLLQPVPSCLNLGLSHWTLLTIFILLILVHS